MKYDTTYQVLCDLISNALLDVDFTVPANVDWNKVYSEAVSQAVVLPAFVNANKFDIPEPTKTMMTKAALQVTQSAVRNFYYHATLHKLLQDSNVDYCIIKGVASASYYKSPFYRGMGDVDFLIKKQDVDHVSKVLKDNGFLSHQSEHDFHIAFLKGKMVFEMHWDPVGMPDSKISEKTDKYFENILLNKKIFECQVIQCYIPDEFHHGLIILFHIQRHMVSGGIGLRQIIDWAVFVNSMPGEKFTELFKNALQDIGLWKFAQEVSLIAVQKLHFPYEEWMGDDYSTAVELFRDIVNSGNFGRKNKQRTYEGLLISDRNSGKMKNGKIDQAISSINQVLYIQFPITKKCKSLLPCYWVYFFARRIVREITGKRQHLNYKLAFEDSENRRKLYKKLKMFESHN